MSLGADLLTLSARSRRSLLCCGVGFLAKARCCRLGALLLIALLGRTLLGVALLLLLLLIASLGQRAFFHAEALAGRTRSIEALLLRIALLVTLLGITLLLRITLLVALLGIALPLGVALLLITLLGITLLLRIALLLGITLLLGVALLLITLLGAVGLLLRITLLLGIALLITLLGIALLGAVGLLSAISLLGITLLRAVRLLAGRRGAKLVEHVANHAAKATLLLRSAVALLRIALLITIARLLLAGRLSGVDDFIEKICHKLLYLSEFSYL